MREVIVYKMERLPGQSFFSKIVVGNARFLEFGVDYEQVEGGPAQYSSALVEMPDGEVKSVPAEMIKFVVSEFNKPTS